MTIFFKALFLSFVIAISAFGNDIMHWPKDTTSSYLNRFSVGLRLGLNFSTMAYSDPTIDNYAYSPQAGGIFGFLVEYEFSKHIAFRTDFLFLEKGGEISDNGFSYEFHPWYADMAFPIIYQFDPVGSIRPYFFTAPVLGFAYGGNIHIEEGNDSWSTGISDASIAPLEFSLMVGAGVKFPTRIKNHIVVPSMELSYCAGLTNTYSDQELNGKANGLNQSVYSIDGKRKNRGVQITFAVAVPLSEFKKSVKKKTEPVHEKEAVVPQPTPDTSGDVPSISCSSIEEINQLIDAKQSVNSKIICMTNLNFKWNESALDENSKEYLSEIVLLLKRIPTMKMNISGHADSTGSAQYNMKLSKERALQAYEYLIGHGIVKDRLQYIYFGASRPLYTNDTEEHRAQNRRVEFEIVE
ncbi:MAG: OmpA family protein [Fibrobacteraceae bacterium]|nr:OmpA family protein [Fibrobacteraceae bacterium]